MAWPPRPTPDDRALIERTKMPQIAQIAETYASQIFWLLLTFGFVFFVIGLGMVPKVQATMEGRDAKITGDLDGAKAAFARADESEAD